MFGLIFLIIRILPYLDPTKYAKESYIDVLRIINRKIIYELTLGTICVFTNNIQEIRKLIINKIPKNKCFKLFVTHSYTAKIHNNDNAIENIHIFSINIIKIIGNINATAVLDLLSKIKLYSLSKPSTRFFK